MSQFTKPSRIIARLALLTLAPTVVFLFLVRSAPAQVDYGQVGSQVANMLNEEHYLKVPFDDEISKKILDNYLEYLDYSRVYFTQEDVDGFREKYETELDDAIRDGDIDAANEIYVIYKDRVQSRVDLVKTLLANKEGEFKFDSDRTVKLTRKDADYPTDMEASDALWHDLVEADLLQEVLRRESDDETEADAPSEKSDKANNTKSDDAEGDAGVIGGNGTNEEEEETTPEADILKRYNRILENVNDNDVEDIAVIFLKSLSHAYDPHTEYFSQSQYDNFMIQMQKSLVGIGAMLRLEEDGSTSIQGIVVGGPAQKSGELQVMDRIVGVGQGDDGKVTDVVGMKLDKIVDMIRGKESTTVRLKVIPVDAADSQTKMVHIVREKIDLKESLASAELILTKDPEGNDQKIGWINLLSFYSDMRGGQTSTTADVRRLVNRLMEEGVDGIVLDLRDNGGGSLEEAINLTGLFIPRGPVVQSLDWQGRVAYKASRKPQPLYDGPLVVLTNRASASASEILAAALQDYNRAVIVGEKATFGKGTVQQLRPVQSTFMRLPIPGRTNEKNGALKLTIQTFFRINGDSTQLKGVIPDVMLPSVNDSLDIGEDSLTNALEVEMIRPQPYALYDEELLPTEALQAATAARIDQNQEFIYIREDIARNEKRLAENAISLNREKRKAEAEEFKMIRETRKEERVERFNGTRESEKGLFTVYSLNQDNVAQPELVLRKDISDEESSGMVTAAKEADPEAKSLEYPHLFDPYKREALHVIQDLIQIESAPEGSKPVTVSEAVEKKAG